MAKSSSRSSSWRGKQLICGAAAEASHSHTLGCTRNCMGVDIGILMRARQYLATSSGAPRCCHRPPLPPPTPTPPPPPWSPSGHSHHRHFSYIGSNHIQTKMHVRLFLVWTFCSPSLLSVFSPSLPFFNSKYHLWRWNHTNSLLFCICCGAPPKRCFFCAANSTSRAVVRNTRRQTLYSASASSLKLFLVTIRVDANGFAGLPLYCEKVFVWSYAWQDIGFTQMNYCYQGGPRFKLFLRAS